MFFTFQQMFIAQEAVKHWSIICHWQILSGTFEFGSSGDLSSPLVYTDREPKTDLLAMMDNPESQIFHSTEKL